MQYFFFLCSDLTAKNSQAPQPGEGLGASCVSLRDTGFYFASRQPGQGPKMIVFLLFFSCLTQTNKRKKNISCAVNLLFSMLCYLQLTSKQLTVETRRDKNWSKPQRKMLRGKGR